MKRCCSRSIKNQCRLLELPLVLLYNVLCRLTVDAIFSCKCVCKTFLEILSDPYFKQIHFDFTKASDSNIDDRSLIILDRNDLSRFLLVYNYNNNNNNNSNNKNLDSGPACQTMAVPNIASQNKLACMSISGICNGLICFSYMDCNSYMFYYVCNPVLGEFYPLPPHVQNGVELAGFGFCPQTKQYRVIKFLYQYKYTEIITVGVDRCWRKIEPLPCPSSVLSIYSCPNGILYWIRRKDGVSKMICRFNLETEQFSYIPPPPHLTQRMIEEIPRFHVAVLDGLFCLSYIIGLSQYEVYVTNDYDNNNNNTRYWTCKLSIDLFSNFDLRDRLWTRSMESFTIKLLENGDLFLKCADGRLVCYNLWTGTIKNMISERYILSYDALSFVPSFISLKDIIAAGEDVEVVKRKMGRNLRSENGFRFISAVGDWTSPGGQYNGDTRNKAIKIIKEAKANKKMTKAHLLQVLDNVLNALR